MHTVHKQGGKGHQRAGDAGNRGHPGGESLFRPKTYKEQGVLTSTEIQKVWLEATKRRKRDLTTLPYLLVETEEDKPDKDKTCTQNRENCTQDADIFPENACNSKQSKESKVKESKAKENQVEEIKSCCKRGI